MSINSQNDDNSFLNRKYKVTFFDVQEDGQVRDVPSLEISDPTEMTIDYTMGLQCFNVATFRFLNIDRNTTSLFSGTNSKRGFRFFSWYQPNESVDNSANAELIFQGLVFSSKVYRRGTELITEVVACDAIFNLSNPKPILYFPPGASGTMILNKLQSYYQGSVSFIGQELLTKVYQRPYTTLNSSLQDILDFLCSDNSCQYSQYSDGIYITGNINKPIVVGSGEIKVISPSTGMVGNVGLEGISPQLLPIDYFSQKELNKNNPFITVSTYMRRYSPTEKVRLQGIEFFELNNKLFQIYGITYSGDFRGHNWFSSLKLYPMG
jgi:hypothetical protein